MSKEPSESRKEGNPAAENRIPSLMAACRDGKFETVDDLVRMQGVPVDAQEHEGTPTPLMYAAISGNVPILQFLLSSGAKIDKQDKDGRHALIFAATNNRPEAVQFLLDSGANPNLTNRNNWSPVYVAATRGFPEIADRLLATQQQQVQVDLPNTVGGTALMAASTMGHTVIAASLLEHGAAVHAKDKNEWTALFRSSDKGHTDIVNLLLNAGADLTHVDNNGFSPLILAAKSGKGDTVTALLAHPSVQLNGVDKSNRSALFYAARNGHLDVVTLLLAREGIDASIEDKNKQTALTVTKVAEITQALQAHLA